MVKLREAAQIAAQPSWGSFVPLLDSSPAHGVKNTDRNRLLSTTRVVVEEQSPPRVECRDAFHVQPEQPSARRVRVKYAPYESTTESTTTNGIYVPLDRTTMRMRYQ